MQKLVARASGVLAFAVIVCSRARRKEKMQITSSRLFRVSLLVFPCAGFCCGGAQHADTRGIYYTQWFLQAQRIKFFVGWFKKILWAARRSVHIRAAYEQRNSARENVWAQLLIVMAAFEVWYIKINWRSFCLTAQTFVRFVKDVFFCYFLQLKNP